jgi:rhodanese-related sulfurtransferase
MRDLAPLLSLTLLICPAVLAATETSERQASERQTAETLLAQAKASVRDISTQDLAALIARDPKAAIVDVRTPRETWLVGGAIDAPRHLSIPRGWLEFRIEESVPQRDTPVVVYCGTNQRSPLAAETLARMGYTQVFNYAEGFSAWRDAGLPVESPDPAPASMLYRLPQPVAEGV